MGEIKWIKLTTNMFEDEKIDFIESLPESDAILIIWIKLLTFAGKCNMGGFIMLTETIAYTPDMLAHKFKKPLNTVKLALDTFNKLEMITVENNIISITNWEKHQNEEKMSTIREYNRLAKQKQRQKEKQKLICQGQVNDRQGDVKTQIIDKDIDTIINNSHKLTRQGQVKDKKPDKVFLKMIEKYTKDTELQKAITNFLEHRKSLNKPVKTEHTLELIFKELDKHDDKIAVIEQSIVNGWQGLFELKATKTKKINELEW